MRRFLHQMGGVMMLVGVATTFISIIISIITKSFLFAEIGTISIMVAGLGLMIAGLSD